MQKDIAGANRKHASGDRYSNFDAGRQRDGPERAWRSSSPGTLKENVDHNGGRGWRFFNQVSNVMSHLGSLNAGYALDVASKMDVDFAGETTELAKGQILAQAGTAMLAQANAQGQGMLALIQS